MLNTLLYYKCHFIIQCISLFYSTTGKVSVQLTLLSRESKRASFHKALPIMAV